MSQLEVADKRVAAVTESVSTAYVPPLQRTKGQPPPIAANGGLSYMSFDQNGNAGTAKALEDALAEIADGAGERVIDMIDKAPRGPIKTRWGLAFCDYDECVKYIRESNSIKAPEGGVALPLPYTVYERPSYAVVPSNHLARSAARQRREDRAQERGGEPAAGPLFPAGAARRTAYRVNTIRVFRPAAPSAWTGLASRSRTSCPSARTSMIRRRWNACSTRRSRSHDSSQYDDRSGAAGGHSIAGTQDRATFDLLRARGTKVRTAYGARPDGWMIPTK